MQKAEPDCTSKGDDSMKSLSNDISKLEMMKRPSIIQDLIDEDNKATRDVSFAIREANRETIKEESSESEDSSTTNRKLIRAKTQGIPDTKTLEITGGKTKLT